MTAALVSSEALADVSIDAVTREYSQVAEVEREQSWMSCFDDWYKSEELNPVRYAKCNARFRWPFVLGDIIQAVRDKILAQINTHKASSDRQIDTVPEMKFVVHRSRLPVEFAHLNVNFFQFSDEFSPALGTQLDGVLRLLQRTNENAVVAYM